MAFSIGDRVLLANGRHDEVYTIRKVNPAKGYKLRTAGGEKHPFWWVAEDLAAADPAFKVGDRVMVNHWDVRPNGEVGEIVGGGPAGSFEVRFDTWRGGHDGSTGDGETKDRWYCPPELLTLIPATDATLYEASFLTSYFGRVVVGQIYGDKKGRFPDGALVSTGPVIEELDGGIIRTRNSVYKMELGRHPKARTFKPGDWVKTTSGDVGIVFHDDGDPEDRDPYQVGWVERGSYANFSANELVPHLPS